jgi:hypothetical protein
MVFTAADALGNWLSFRLHEESMLVAAGGAGHALWDVARGRMRQRVLLEVRDECSFGDIAGGLGYSLCFEAGGAG